MTVEEKKKYLSQYRPAVAHMKQLLVDYEEICSLAVKTTSTITDMPRAQGISDPVQNGVERMDEAARKILQYITELESLRQNIITAIKEIDDKRLEMILYGHFVIGQTLEEISFDMGVDYRWLMRLYKRALEKINLPDTIKSPVPSVV